MRYILVHVGPIKKYPPALSVLQHLSDLGNEVILCSMNIDENTKKTCENRGIKIEDIGIDYEKEISIISKFLRLFTIQKKLWATIDKYYTVNSVIWVFSDLALKHLGNKLKEKQFVLQMFELSEKSIYYRKFPLLALDTKKYANKALAVVHAEYNRAHIAKAWWGLKKTPYILPNKPYENDEIEKFSHINDKIARDMINKLQNKKIILYQGVLGNERPLEPFVKAVDSLGSDYALIVMTDSPNRYDYLKSQNLYFIPFISPPHHLQVTSHAYIGILSYIPNENSEFSVLNAVYCAPNKLYEYSKFNIPMIGNNIPGLNNIYEKYNCGICFEQYTEKDIIDTIKTIENNYQEYESGSSKLYEDTNNKRVMRVISEEVKKEIYNKRYVGKQ